MIQDIRRRVSKCNICIVTKSHHSSIWDVQWEEIFEPEGV